MVLKTKRGQVTLFIVLGIVIVMAIIGYFIVRNINPSSIVGNFQPAYDYYVDCMKDKAETGVKLLGQNGGYIYTEDLFFEPGSVYAPTSSQLSLGGTGVPYWSYVSGNNVWKEQKPTVSIMEEELSRYISERINDCNFDNFNARGVFVSIYAGEVDVTINDNSVDVLLNNPIYFYSEEENESAVVSEHEFSVKSNLGKFYNIASSVFDAEDEQTFLESYGLDVMRLYAPVTGVELSCSPKVFKDSEIINEIYNGLETNIPFLKLRGGNYELSKDENKYFVVDLEENVEEYVSFSYSRDWPTKIEIYGNRIAEPVGMQEGLAALGFCYVPYHFVYDISFPVLFQVYDENELFQFPMVSVIKNSQARSPSLLADGSSAESELCKYKNQKVRVSTFNLDGEPVAANLRFSCLSEGCSIGSTEIKSGEAAVTADFPQCVNGILTAQAEGYASSDYVISTNRESSADILMMKIYNVSVNLGNIDKAIVLFSSEDYSSALNYPESKYVQLIEGEYNITSYVYANSELVFPAVSEQQCIDVTASGIAGLLGEQEQKCFDINIEEQVVDSALIGGGHGYDYFTESQLKSGKTLAINIPLFGNPKSTEELQNNYIEMEDSTLDISFR